MKSVNFSSAQIKIAAAIIMLVDYIGFIFLEYPSAIAGRFNVRNLDMLLRSVGRLTFPMFLFCLSEGFFIYIAAKSILCGLFYPIHIILLRLFYLSAIPFVFRV